MMLNLDQLYEKYKLKVKGVIEVGAHWGQEYDEYKKHGVEFFVFIEPCKKAHDVLQNKFGGHDDVILFNCACGDVSGPQTMYTGPTNNGMSNSLLKPKVHLEQHPEVIFPDTEEVQVLTLDSLYFDPTMYNLLNMDCQGFEDRVLKGATQILKLIDYVYTEVNRLEMYEGNGMIEDIDAILSDFQRVETLWASHYHGWGDAFYVRKTLL